MAEDIKKFKFEVLPPGAGKWIVLAWGKIVNERKGNYEQEILIKRFSPDDKPSILWDLGSSDGVVSCQVNLGSLRIFSPGTVIEDQQIVQFPHEYLEKRQLEISKPQELLWLRYRGLFQKGTARYEEDFFDTALGKVRCRVLQVGRRKVVIPCDVIADYYYYGTTYLTKAILEGRLSSRFKNRNDAYNPREIDERVTPSGMTVVRVELHRRMSLKDSFKIARLAYDDFFRGKCLDIFAGILKSNNLESYVDTDLPVREPATLSVYGVEISSKRGNFFLVHSISRCSSKAPFDLIFVSKDFKGVVNSPDSKDENGGDGSKNDSLGLSSKDGSGTKKRRRKQLSKGGKTIVGGGKAHSDSDAEDIPFNKDQSNNFPDNAAIDEQNFADPEKRKELAALLKEYGIATELTTNPSKSGSSNSLQLNFFNQLPPKKPAPVQTTAFQIIEEITELVTSRFKIQDLDVSTQIRCPVVEGIDKYSAFPVDEVRVEGNPDLNRKYMNFCFVNVRTEKYTRDRRVYIVEVVVNKRVFYLIDVEPKYREINEKLNTSRFVSSFAVVFYTGTFCMSDVQLKDVLVKIVKAFGTDSGQWKFLKNQYGFPFYKVQHKPPESAQAGVYRFMEKYLSP
ncbi:MAG: hypothetical protein ACK5DD_14895 [Cyclobacteriaceae bacterium]